MIKQACDNMVAKPEERILSAIKKCFSYNEELTVNAIICVSVDGSPNELVYKINRSLQKDRDSEGVYDLSMRNGHASSIDSKLESQKSSNLQTSFAPASLTEEDAKKAMSMPASNRLTPVTSAPISLPSNMISLSSASAPIVAALLPSGKIVNLSGQPFTTSSLTGCLANPSTSEQQFIQLARGGGANHQSPPLSTASTPTTESVSPRVVAKAIVADVEADEARDADEDLTTFDSLVKDDDDDSEVDSNGEDKSDDVMDANNPNSWFWKMGRKRKGANDYVSQYPHILEVTAPDATSMHPGVRCKVCQVSINIMTNASTRIKEHLMTVKHKRQFAMMNEAGGNSDASCCIPTGCLKTIAGSDTCPARLFPAEPDEKRVRLAADPELRKICPKPDSAGLDMTVKSALDAIKSARAALEGELGIAPESPDTDPPVRRAAVPPRKSKRKSSPIKAESMNLVDIVNSLGGDATDNEALTALLRTPVEASEVACRDEDSPPVTFHSSRGGGEVIFPGMV